MLSRISFSVSSSFFSVEEIFLHKTLTDILIASTLWCRESVMLLITPSLIPAIRASASLADAMLGRFGVVFFSIVWRILALLRDSDHKSDRDMFGFCLLHLAKVCGHYTWDLVEHIQLSRLTALHLKVHHDLTSDCVCLSHVHFLQAWLGLSCQVISEDKRSHPLICNQCSPLYFSPNLRRCWHRGISFGTERIKQRAKTWAINHSVTPA